MLTISREVAAHSHWADFRSIGDAQCLENTPWLEKGVSDDGRSIDCSGAPYYAAQYLSHEESNNVLCREEDGSPSNDKHKTANDGPPIAKPLRDPSVQQQSDQLAYIGTV